MKTSLIILGLFLLSCLLLYPTVKKEKRTIMQQLKEDWWVIPYGLAMLCLGMYGSSLWVL